ncbi:hypothetical protein AMTRI_Chr05g57200 [Amborella trichopoda]
MENSHIHHESKRGFAERKGGMKTMPFIIANETFEKVASYGLQANMILYLMTEYNLNPVSAAKILFTWSATSNFMPIIGAFVSDSYLGRFRVITLGSIATLLGMIILWLTAAIPNTRPPSCPTQKTCFLPSPSQIAILLTSFALMSIGTGGIRPCSLAFGADQLAQSKSDPKTGRTLQRFFNWYYVSVGLSVMIAVTVIVYIQDVKGWIVGFGVPVILMALSTAFFTLGSPFYVKKEAQQSVFTGLFQVVAAAIKKRHQVLPIDNIDGMYYHRGSKLATPTQELRSLNKTCMITDPAKDLKPDGSAQNPWTLCTVQQVEDLKSLIKVFPIWSTGITISIAMLQHGFPVLQATAMDRHLGPNFQIPAGSFGVFSLLALTAWVAIYEPIIGRVLKKLTGKRPSNLFRLGAGLLISTGSMAVAALVESARLKEAHRTPEKKMSALWLIPQHCLAGIAEALNFIGQIEFYYTECPKNMSSVGVALLSLGMAVGNLLGDVVLTIVDGVSRNLSGVSWVPRDINKGHYDYYYWVLAIMSLVNFFYFLLCSWLYRYRKDFVVEGVDTKEYDEEILSKSRELPLPIR